MSFWKMFGYLSALQKDIRRGNEKQALHFAIQVEKFDYVILWNRLKIIASEDIGVATPMMPILIDTLAKHYVESLQRKNDAYRLFLSNAIIVLCRSEKTRISDDLLWIVYPQDIEGKNPSIPDYAKGKHYGEAWEKEGTKLENEANISNPYTNEANRFKRKYKNKLPKIFPKRPKRGRKKKKR